MKLRARMILMGAIFEREIRRRPQSAAALPHECIVLPLYCSRFYELFLLVCNTARGPGQAIFSAGSKDIEYINISP